MTHDASISTLRFERMPPQAMALALLFHALVALALWQMSLQAKRLPPPPDPNARVSCDPSSNDAVLVFDVSSRGVA